MPRTSYQFYKTHHTPQQRIEKSLEICKLIARGYPVYEASDICELGNSTFYHWVRTYPDIKAMYHQAVDIFKSCQLDEFLFRSYKGLEEQLKSKIMSDTTKIGIPDKNGKITTQSVIQKTHTREPNLKAIIKVLTDTFGTEREREKAAKNSSESDDYSLRLKTDEELEEELLKLDAKLKAMDKS